MSQSLFYDKLLTHASLFSGIGGRLSVQGLQTSSIAITTRSAVRHSTTTFQIQTVMTISKQPTSVNTATASLFSPEDFPASHSHLQESERERQMTVTSGRRCFELYGRYDPLGLLAKTLLESPQWYNPLRKFEWRVQPTKLRRVTRTLKSNNPSSLSKPSAEILSRKDTPSSRLLFRLAASAHRTSGTGCGSLQELMTSNLLPTPVASDATMGAVIGKEDSFRITSTGMPRKMNRNGQDGSVGLARLVKLWDLLPTPTATDATRGGEIVTGNRKIRPSGTEYSLTLNDLALNGLLPTPVASDKNGGSTRTDPQRQFSCALQDYVHGVAQQKDNSRIGHSSQLNPRFTLEMMGFPATWLDNPYLTQSGASHR